MTRSIFSAMLLVLICALVNVGCKQEASTTEAGEEASPATSNTGGDETNPALVENMPWTFLTHKILQNRATVVSGRVGENPKEGHWIDFKENGTFEYGVYDKKTDGGTWSYNNDTRLLEMTPRNGSPSEWKVMHKEDNIVFIGTARFGNNSNQEQWVRRDGLPGTEAPADDEN